MLTKYLFRFDNAKDNDEFFKSVRGQGVSNVYAGAVMEIGPGWIPDFLMVLCDNAERSCTLTLIELESKKADALISSRKYLPESSAEILGAFHNYLNGVIARCYSTADPRISVIEGLQAFLREAPSIRIETACALRSDTTFLEQRPLLDQPQTGAVVPHHSFERDSLESPSASSMTFEGHITLSRYEAIGLNRTVLILDATVRQQDHSDANVKAWLSPKRNPLQKAISNRRGDFPETWRFLDTDKNNGAKVTCETLLGELATFWSDETDKQFSLNIVRGLVQEYYPIAYKLKGEDRMRDVFEGVKPVIGKQICD